MLAKAIHQVGRKMNHLKLHKELLNGVHFAYWPQLLDQLREREFWRLTTCCTANLLVLDELTIDHDPNGFAADKLSQMLSRRVGHWTVITTNLTIDRIDGIDGRIASRMVRDGSKVVNIGADDYARRKVA